jgi:hypothetical protein
MAVVLSISGFEQAGFFSMHTQLWWSLRALSGLLFLFGLLFMMQLFSLSKIKVYFNQLRAIDIYNLIGFLSDGLGGLLLLLFGSTLYSMIGQIFTGGYQLIVFGFVMGVGVVHLMGYFLSSHAYALAQATLVLRVITAAGFFALYKAGILGWIAFAISGIDLLFVLVYLLIKDLHEKNTTY